MTPSVFPNEILSEIFLAACAATLANRSDLLRSLSQVCRHWRQAALGCGQLWTQADYQRDHPEWLAEQLRRSRNAPVVVKAHLSSHRAIQNVRSALAKAAVRTLDFDAPLDALNELFLDCKPLLALENLSLFITCSAARPTFQLRAPNLKSLSLSNLAFPWDASIFQNLTQLRLHMQDASHSPSMRQILTVLSCSPFLTELVLLHAIQSSAQLPCPESIGAVPLSHLSTLTFDDDILNHIFLLHHLDIPALRHLSLKIENRTENLSQITEFGQLISRVLPSDVKLRVEAASPSIIIRECRAVASQCIQISLRYRVPISTPDLVSAAGAMISTFTLCKATALKLIIREQNSAAVSAETWRMCLRNFGALESLHSTPITPQNLISALTVEPEKPVLLSRLQRLDMHHADLLAAANPADAGHLGSWWRATRVTRGTFSDVLLECVESRKRAGSAISSLRLAVPHRPDHWESLEAAVKQVILCIQNPS